MIKYSDPLIFRNGLQMKNRFMLAPMTNTQSHDDGTLSDEEFRWLTMRAAGQFGITMTCASHVLENGRGFPGQLGIFDDRHIEGHRRLTDALRKEGSLSVIQLQHAGIRSPEELVPGGPVGPSAHERSGSRALTTDEVEALRDAFIQSALRAQHSGYDGVEIHGAHGYIVAQFLSAQYNQRTDRYGGSPENRARFTYEIVRGVREACGPGFLLGIRLSPERFGMELPEVVHVCKQLISEGDIDLLDLSLWDSFKPPEDPAYQGRSLLSVFTDIDRGEVALTVAGNIRTGTQVSEILLSGVDFVTIGRAAILHHDFPKRVMANPAFEPVPLPVTAEYLMREGLSPRFIDYMDKWPGFVAKEHAEE